MSTNGRMWLADYRRTVEACDRSEEYLRGEIARLEAQLGATAEHRARMEAAAYEAGAPEELRRSKMSALQISRFIRSHPGGPAAGAAAFKELPL